MQSLRTRFFHAAAALTALLLCSASSCYEDEDDDVFDRRPPAGLGSLIVDNNTFSDISVFINGTLFPETRDGRARPYDLSPGVYRVILEEQGGDQNFRDDVDILEGRNTILDVAFGPDNEYDVVVFFENP